MSEVPGEDAEPSANHIKQALTSALNKALSIQGSAISKNLARARQRHPDATPAQVIKTLETMYRAALTGTGAAVGAVAAAPGVGTGAAIALSGGEVLTSLELTTIFVLSVAEVHGVRVEELERRRTLVLGVALGGGGSETIAKISERTGQYWAKQLIEKIPYAQILKINKVLGRNFVTKYGTKQGIIVLGRVVPFGIGAVIGGGANLALSEITVRASRRAFGPAPTTWPAKIEAADDVADNYEVIVLDSTNE